MPPHPNHTERFYDLNDGPVGGVDAVKVGIIHTAKWAQDHGRDSSTIVVPTRARVEDLKPHIGATSVRELLENGQALIHGITFRLGTKRDLPFIGDTPVIAVWVNDDLLADIDDRHPPVIYAVAGWEGAIPKWLANWQPKPARPATTPLTNSTTEVSPLLEVALKDITLNINLSSGLIDPNDRGLAIAVIQAFEEGNEPYDPAAMRIWAINNGWPTDAAGKLEELAQGVRNGTRYRNVRQLPANILDLYRAKLASP